MERPLTVKFSRKSYMASEWTPSGALFATLYLRRHFSFPVPESLCQQYLQLHLFSYSLWAYLTSCLLFSLCANIISKLCSHLMIISIPARHDPWEFRTGYFSITGWIWQQCFFKISSEIMPRVPQNQRSLTECQMHAAFPLPASCAGSGRRRGGNNEGQPCGAQ